MRTGLWVWGSLLCLIYGGRVSAQMFSNPIGVSGQNRTSFAGTFVSSEVDYEYEDETGDIERKILAVEYARGLSSKMDFFGHFGFIFNAEADDFDYAGLDPEGKGFVLGGGARGIVFQSHFVTWHAYGLFNYFNEQYEDKSNGTKFTLKQTFYELQGGAVAVFAASPDIDVYVGPELVLMSDGKADGEVEAGGGSTDIDLDMERDDMMNLKFGAVFDLGNFSVRPEITVMGESTILVSVLSNF